MVVCLRWLYHHVLSVLNISGESCILYLSLLCSLHITSSSSSCRHVWRYSTSKILVCLRLSQFSQLSFMQYTRLCVFSLPISLIKIVRIRVLYLITIINSETHLLLLKVRSCNSGMRCMSFYILIKAYRLLNIWTFWPSLDGSWCTLLSLGIDNKQVITFTKTIENN